jgi:hypothetical protein
MSNFFLTLNSLRSSLYSKKWLLFVLPMIVFGVSFVFFSIVESLVITLIFYAIFSGKGTKLLTIGALVFLILIPILQILDEYVGFTFPLFDGEELAVGVFYLLCLSVIFELLSQFIYTPSKTSSQTTEQKHNYHPLLNSVPAQPIILPHEPKPQILLEAKPLNQPLLIQPQSTPEHRKFILIPKSFDSVQKAKGKPTVINFK